jgi:hypothetical protein
MNKKASVSKEKLRCDICGKRFKKGQTRYRINIEVISDFDGYIEDFSKKPQDYLEKKIQQTIKETEELTERELEEEVYLKRQGLVCVNCREEFLKILGKFMGKT